VLVRPLGTAAEVLLATDHDPFARGSLRRPLVRGWAADGACAWLGVDSEERRSYLSFLGERGAVGALLAELLPELPSRQRLTVPRGAPARFPAWAGMDGVDWDFRWLPEPPPVQRGEDSVEPVDDALAVTSLLAASSSRASVQPGTRPPCAGSACGTAPGRCWPARPTRAAPPGVGHLSSIAVVPAARGPGARARR
jgi:hypothetical protein